VPDRKPLFFENLRIPPPQLIWIICGNTSNLKMRAILEKSLEKAMELIRSGEPIVEISDLA
jgi:predicted nuclease of predicted toxin-antitoxin system